MKLTALGHELADYLVISEKYQTVSDEFEDSLIILIIKDLGFVFLFHFQS